MPGDFLMGIDIGSGAAKVTILKTDINDNYHFNTYVNEYSTIYKHAGWAEQDSSQWIDSVSLLIKKVFAENKLSGKNISAVCLSGVTHSPVLLDKRLNVLGNVIHITDNRSNAQALKLSRFNELFLKYNFNPVSPMWTAPMLLWVKENEPDRYKKISKIIFPKDYIRMMLTGQAATDEIDAQGTLFFDTLNKKWSPELSEAAGIDMKILPEVLPPLSIAGKVTGSGSLWSGLSEGTPVVTGTTDTLLEILAAGNISRGDCTVKLATFGRICILSGSPAPFEGIINYSYIVPGLWYPGTGTKSCASSYRWARDEFFRDYIISGKKSKTSAYKMMDDDASDIAPGSNGLIFHPYLSGEGSPYNDALLRGDFTGLTLHHTRAHLARSVMEGTAFSLKDSIDFLKIKKVIPSGDIKFIGGGSQSRLWTAILANILGSNGIIPSSTDASFGAAMLSGVATGVFPSIEGAVNSCVRYREKITYNKSLNKKYSDYYKLYKESVKALIEISHKLSGLAGG